ncbi:iron-sulfur cluster assembly scaffold protein [Adlercreutzia faecimuris]|uniref:Iron-sulfur cluster assembly scaffold protein n=1 Tax=Adlercreutzia faecimuris TaxID=2897341 RepID=A0ABS9WEE4_9ACTN|nr:iron-sulfur cluster assembly scaffold protein [Adlercreutzia sp. JBNU-10]MCI2241233.1 iron-sulfur cluster assembly scaffold protein [Adlercreutzia sp. JBNU-10]
MGESRNVYVELEDKVLLRTADVYQTAVGDDVESYSDTLLAVVANFRNAGRPEGTNAQSMAGKSKRGEIACRLFAVVDPETRVVRKAGFKARGCLAITACASVVCSMMEGRVLEDALAITVDDVREALDGVPAGKTNTLYFAVEAVRGLVGDYLVREGATLAELDAAVGCDEASVACMMCEHCSLRTMRTEMLVDALEGAGGEEAAAAGAPASAGAVPAPAAAAAAATSAAVGAAGAPAAEEGAGASEPDEAAEADGTAFPDDVAPTERNAVALALEAVRGASRASRLATPALWEELGLVPPDMTTEDLEMRVYDCLMAWQADHPEDAAPDASGAATPAEAGRNRAARRSPFGPRRAVGAPTGFKARLAAARAARAEEASAIEAPRTGAASAAAPEVVAVAAVQHDAPAPAAAPAPDPAAEEARVAAALAALDDFVEEEAADEPLNDDDPFPTLHAPEGTRLVRRDGAYVLVEDAVDAEAPEPASVPAETPAPPTPATPAETPATPASDADDELPIRCEGIALIMGAHGYYLYDRAAMTDAYAHWAFLAAEDDPVATFLDCVREESRVYPRPLPAKNLANEPLCLDAAAVEAAYEAARADAANADIERIEASNGDVYFFSTRHLEPAYAQSLAEWASVERFRNV